MAKSPQLKTKKTMKPLELRLDNYVANEHGFAMYIVDLARDMVYLEFQGNEGDIWECETKLLKPLPIEEYPNVLIELGFNYDKERDIHINLDEDKCIIYLKKSKDGMYDVFSGEVHGRVQYIHELQNFVFDNLDIELLENK